MVAVKDREVSAVDVARAVREALEGGGVSVLALPR